MIGRGLRKFPNKKFCVVLDVVDNFKKNSPFTLPFLFGLVPLFDAKGRVVFSFGLRLLLYNIIYYFII